ncbi:MAG TPA: lysophospholipid acyltransferase family protein [Burkholderiales bacterium]
MLIGLLRLFAGLPLSWIHAAGSALGWIVYLFSPAYSARLRENLLQGRLWRDAADFQRILRENVSESGKAATELIPVWFRSKARAARLMVSDTSLALIAAADARGKGIIFLTPHLGCPDIAALYVSQRRPLTVLYRPPKLKMLQPLIEAGRRSASLELAPTNLHGVRLLLKALKRGNAIGILPDQAPSVGEGAWADFFGRPAYTMTLVGRLAESSGATVIMTFARRLPRGAGYAFEAIEVTEPLNGAQGARALNAAVEQIVARAPGQYLWAYNRFKVPAGAPPPGAGGDAKAGADGP